MACHPLQGDAFGCPYKTLSAPELAAALGRMRLPPRAADEAGARARAGHFQLACALAFEGAHGCACDTGINHPNQARCHMDGRISSDGSACWHHFSLSGGGTYPLQPSWHGLQ